MVIVNIEIEVARVEFDPSIRYKEPWTNFAGFVGNIWKDGDQYKCNLGGFGKCYQVIPGEVYDYNFYGSILWRMIVEGEKHFVEVLKPKEMKKVH